MRWREPPRALASAPTVPLALRGLWGSFFSRKDGPAMSRVPRRGPFSRIELVAGDAVAPDAATPAALQAIVAGLRGERPGRFRFTRDEWRVSRQAEAELRAHQRAVRAGSYLPAGASRFRVH